MNAILKGLAHLFVSTAAVSGTTVILTGDPITSGHVLIPSAIAGALAVGHAVFPSIIDWNPTPPPPPPPTKDAKFPGTR